MPEVQKRVAQVIAVEKEVTKRVMEWVTEAYKILQKPTLFNGFTRTYEPKAAEGEDAQPLPPESERVQKVADALMRDAFNFWAGAFDATATKDFANCDAKADVMVDGKAVLKGAPVTFLLFVEKMLVHVHSFVSKLPTLDPAYEWARDEGTGLFRTPSSPAVRTKKAQRPIVLYDATKEHPAQTQLITEDIPVGTWTLTKMSGAVQEARRDAILARVEKLSRAVKEAREEANAMKCNEQRVGEALFAYLLG